MCKKAEMMDDHCRRPPEQVQINIERGEMCKDARSVKSLGSSASASASAEPGLLRGGATHFIMAVLQAFRHMKMKCGTACDVIWEEEVVSSTGCFINASLPCWLCYSVLSDFYVFRD